MHYDTFVSDDELDIEFAFDLNSRIFEQKFLYTGIGAKSYYDACHHLNEQFKDIHCDLFEEVFKQHVNEDERVVIISLGCGNCYNDKYILENLQKYKNNITYIGVDVSHEMLEYGMDMLSSLEGIEKKFIRADYNKIDFKKKLQPYIKEFDKRFFRFLGNTFCTSVQTLIADSLYNIMLPDDLLRMDLNTRVVNDQNTHMRLFERYSERMHDDLSVGCYCAPILNLGVLLDNGKLVMETAKESSVGALSFNFSFEILKKTVMQYREETYHFLPGELIRLIQLRNYHLPSFIHFMEEHQLASLHTESTAQDDLLDRTWFLFQRK